MKIIGKIGEHFLARAARLFDGSLETLFSELLQNCRRAGAKNVRLELTGNKPTVVRLYNDGRTMEPRDFMNLLELSSSGWDEAVRDQEEPAGIGFYVLSRSPKVVIVSGPHVVHLTREVFAGREEAEVQPNQMGFSDETGIMFELEDPPHLIVAAFKNEVQYQTAFEGYTIEGLGVNTKTRTQPYSESFQEFPHWGVRLWHTDGYPIPGIRLAFVGSSPRLTGIFDPLLPMGSHLQFNGVIEILPGSKIQMVHPARTTCAVDENTVAFRSEIAKALIVRALSVPSYLSYQAWEGLCQQWGELPMPEKPMGWGQRKIFITDDIRSAVFRRVQDYFDEEVNFRQPHSPFKGFPWYDALPQVRICAEIHEGGEKEIIECHGESIASEGPVKLLLMQGDKVLHQSPPQTVIVLSVDEEDPRDMEFLWDKTKPYAEIVSCFQGIVRNGCGDGEIEEGEVKSMFEELCDLTLAERATLQIKRRLAGLCYELRVAKISFEGHLTPGEQHVKVDVGR